MSLEQSAAADQWNRIGIRHHHGVNIALFSLKTQQSCGIGEYLDLLPLVDWCASVGFDIIQLLPLNDTGPDQSPYSAVSAFALNPLHLSLAQLPHTQDYPSLQRIVHDLQALNALPRIPYAQVRTLKKSFLQHYYAWEFASVANSPEYLSFVEQNDWLQGYSLFKIIKRQRLWQPWEEWPEPLRNPTVETIKALHERYLFEAQYHQFLQYLCFQQLKAVKKKANAAGIFLKGDIPILISRESADLWQHRDLFHVEYAAGAPPDFYAAQGQKWGFPIYNWQVLEQQDYRWWRKRLQVAGNFYDLYRLDHVVGFFRIWAIPLDKPATEGAFQPSEEATWLGHGEKILRMILQSSPMLPIGEDLGNIPNGVRPCLRQLGICGTKVMRWERAWNTTREFINPATYYPESMTTVSTHDSTTLSGWWKENADEAQLYTASRDWSYQPEITQDQRRAILYDSHHSGSLFHINLLQEYLAMFPELVHASPEQERINIPGTISDDNWSYRYLPTVEEIVAHTPLADAIRGMDKRQ